MDFLKGVCILFVISTHYPWGDEIRLKYLCPFWIDMAVPVFMILSGFVASKSFYRHNVDCLEKAYCLQNLYGRMLRYTIPFGIAFGIEEFLFFWKSTGHRFEEIFWLFLRGGQGPGGYYYPCMMQFIFWFPIIFFLIEKKGRKGLFLCGLINFIFELLKTAYGMDSGCYRLLIFRYTLVIGFGCYLAISEEKASWRQDILLMGAGILYIFCFVYRGYTPVIMEYWTGTSFLACLFILPVSRKLIYSGSLRCKPLEWLGKASYHIYLTQMVFYIGANSLYHRIPNRMCQVILNFTICLIGGLLFYKIETPINRFIENQIGTWIGKRALK